MTQLCQVRRLSGHGAKLPGSDIPAERRFIQATSLHGMQRGRNPSLQTLPAGVRRLRPCQRTRSLACELLLPMRDLPALEFFGPVLFRDLWPRPCTIAEDCGPAANTGKDLGVCSMYVCISVYLCIEGVYALQ